MVVDETSIVFRSFDPLAKLEITERILPRSFLLRSGKELPDRRANERQIRSDSVVGHEVTLQFHGEIGERLSQPFIRNQILHEF